MVFTANIKQKAAKLLPFSTEARCDPGSGFPGGMDQVSGGGIGKPASLHISWVGSVGKRPYICFSYSF